MSRSLSRSVTKSAVVLFVAMFAMSSCSTVDADAVRVADTSLSTDALDELLDGYSKATQSGLLPSGNVDAVVARLVIRDWITSAILETTLSEYGVELSQSDLDEAATSLDEQVGFADAPDVVRDFYIRATALRTVAGVTFSPDREELADLYASGPEKSGVVCLRLILTESRESIDEALQRITDGENFGDVARAVSKDSSAQQGGILMNSDSGLECLAFEDVVANIVEPIADVIPDLRPDDVVGPIEVPQLGWVAIVLRPFSEVSKDAEKVSGPVTATRLTESALENASVWVNPEFGRWDLETKQVVATS